MSGWSTHKGKAIALDIENVDTDQLIPARFMSTPRSMGYDAFLLHDLRFDKSGVPNTDFPANRHPDATLLVGRRNFGSGSSREAAVYALVDFGFRAVIAPSFGDIFASNAVNNGVLPAQVSEADAARLISLIGQDQVAAHVDIGSKTITVDDQSIPFTLSEAWACKLVNGWDDIDLTQHHRSAISAYRARRAEALPWAFACQETKV